MIYGGLARPQLLFMSDETGAAVFQKSRTLGEKIRAKTWVGRRSSDSRENTPTPDHLPLKDGGGSVTSPLSSTTLPPCPSPPVTTPPCEQGAGGTTRISRFFSLRRSHDHSRSGNDSHHMHSLTEEDEDSGGVLLDACEGPYHSPPALPPAPLVLGPEQGKRRLIINSLIQSENNYLDSLERLLKDYKKPLEESNPPILAENKVSMIFYKLPEILQCHAMFRIELADVARKWDQDERIGDAFVASFSKSIVLEAYSDFINNFTDAMEVAKTESKRKSAFADFLKVKQITAHDRLNFYGLIVKPIQRFPQFILLLQDLLKETPPGHSDRMALQLALTTLESLAEMLNERKREAEQIAAFRAKMRQIGSKLGRSETGRVLLREDEVQRLEFNSSGQVTRSKPRRLLLLNDRVVCVVGSGRPSEVEMSSAGVQEKLTLKWSAGVDEIEVMEGTGTGTLARITTSHGKKSSLVKSDSTNVDKQMAENLAQDMADLMADFDLVSRISQMATGLKCEYEGLTQNYLHGVLDTIQKSIRQKDEEMSWLDKSCLHLAIKRKDKLETLTFQMKSPAVKQDWVTELRLARLALSPHNSPGWEILDKSKFTGRLPLYVQHLPVLNSEVQTEITCGTSYTLLIQTPTRTLRPVTYVWVNAYATEGHSSHLKVFSIQLNQKISLKELGCHLLSSCSVRVMQYVPGGGVGACSPGLTTSSGGNSSNQSDQPLAQDLVWVGTDDHRILLYGAHDPDKGREVGRISLQAEPVSLVYHGGQVFVGLANGHLNVYNRNLRQCWILDNPSTVNLGRDSVSALLPVAGGLFLATGRRVLLLESTGFNVLRQITIHGEEAASFVGSVISLCPGVEPGNVTAMAVAGVGLWVAVANSSNIQLYHTESFIHLQDINIASNVQRVLRTKAPNAEKRKIFVTALSAAKGLLWVGTNVGIALTIPLPRLEGVPIISGKTNISFHAHFGPVRMFLPITQKVAKADPPDSSSLRPPIHQTIPEESSSDLEDSGSGGSGRPVQLRGGAAGVRHKLTKQMSEVALSESGKQQGLLKQISSPLLGSKRSSRESMLIRKASKTLPRGFTLGPGSESSGDSVYGLYGDLMNIQDYEYSHAELELSSNETHRSDPDLDTLPYQVNTLDRRVTMKSQRPKSLDLSSWSVESRGSNQTTSSSETGSIRTSPSVSRTASCASDNSVPSQASSDTTSGRGSMSRTLTREGSEVSAPTTSNTASTNTVTTSSTNKSTAAVASTTITTTTSQSSSSKEKDKEQAQRTIITLMGGRGYIQWQGTATTVPGQQQQINNNNAHLVIWDYKQLEYHPEVIQEHKILA